MPKMQTTARTTDGHQFTSSLEEGSQEHIDQLVNFIQNNWRNMEVLHIVDGLGGTFIPMENLSFVRIQIVEE